MRLSLFGQMPKAVLWATLCLIFSHGVASAVGFRISQVGGTAVNGVGEIGDTVTVAVDFELGEDEAIIGASATVAWDAEGGNVLDIVSSSKGNGGIIGGLNFGPVNDRYLLTNSGERTGRDDRFFEDGRDFSDSQSGLSLLHGLDLIFPALLTGDEEDFLEIIENGRGGPALIRMAEVTFQLSALGTTTLGFFNDESSTLTSLVSGRRGIRLAGDDLTLEEISVSSIGFSALSITVIPEPSAALLLLLGLIGLSAGQRGYVGA